MCGVNAARDRLCVYANWPQMSMPIRVGLPTARPVPRLWNQNIVFSHEVVGNSPAPSTGRGIRGPIKPSPTGRDGREVSPVAGESRHTVLPLSDKAANVVVTVAGHHDAGPAPHAEQPDNHRKEKEKGRKLTNRPGEAVRTCFSEYHARWIMHGRPSCYENVFLGVVGC